MRLSYYPGCSLLGTSKEFDESTRLVCQKMDMELNELPDWNCCGATSAHCLNPLLSIALPARNLKIAEKMALDLVVPCAACYNRMKITDNALRHDIKMSQKIKNLLDFEYTGAIKILHVLEVFDKFIGFENIRVKIVRPLKNMKVVCYYGCLLVRPHPIMKFDDPENPMILDNIMSVMGAEPLNWSHKTECCGGSLSLTRDDIVSDLVSKIVELAKETGADAIVVACPLCGQNLEMRQKENLPVFYFTELLGLALGMAECKEWLDKHLIDVHKLLKSLDLEV